MSNNDNQNNNLGNNNNSGNNTTTAPDKIVIPSTQPDDRGKLSEGITPKSNPNEKD
ncbi:MAG: hypothetical protein Q8L81_12635 [Bacteroidota bacterium]|jgi:hypothetical protein|nr:hypothetical protein [Bacteroidota bacterium]